MQSPREIDVLLERLIAKRAGSAPAEAPETGEVAASVYTSVARFESERAVFARTPSPVALDVELAERGACLEIEVCGVSLVLVRGDDGVVRAFRNACRHRSTELVARGAVCTKKAFVCPYHGWTYDLRGRRIHAPHEHCFGDEASRTERIALAPAFAESRHGLVWVALESFDLDAHLAPLADDLTAMRIEDHRLHRRATREVVGNWKLIVDAFLDGYHIRHLHRDSIYRFFIDALVEPQAAGPHVRALTARRTIDDAARASSRDARELATPSYLVFPSTILVLHPDFTSVLTCAPRAADRTLFSHAMLVPKGDARTEHWDKSFALIDDAVFGREDLGVVEAIQRGLATGANESVLFGDLERASLWFHRTLDERVDQFLSAKNKSRPPLPDAEK
jgi:phenylpropionate dioxygenase-like ring-hydroxylating dioxygenase large terminal subunit